MGRDRWSQSFARYIEKLELAADNDSENGNNIGKYFVKAEEAQNTIQIELPEQ